MAEMDNSLPIEELERRRRLASERRKSMLPQKTDAVVYDSEAMNVINEIFNPTFKMPSSSGQYTLPEEMNADDRVEEKDLDIRKLAELKEVFVLFDVDCDGRISKEDLRFTYTALGGVVTDEVLDEMLEEAQEPLDFEGFIQLIFRRTAELDPEDVLVEAWSKWDDYGTGKIEEKRIYEELTSYGDRLSTNEANEALKYAPMAKPKSLEEPPMIDYPAFCQMLCGLRKRKT